MLTQRGTSGGQVAVAMISPIGQEFFSDGHMPDGFSDWAWTDIQKYVVVLARGGNMVGVKPGVFVTCCTDGFRPVFFKLERVEED